MENGELCHYDPSRFTCSTNHDEHNYPSQLQEHLQGELPANMDIQPEVIMPPDVQNALTSYLEDNMPSFLEEIDGYQPQHNGGEYNDRQQRFENGEEIASPAAESMQWVENSQDDLFDNWNEFDDI